MGRRPALAPERRRSRTCSTAARASAIDGTAPRLAAGGARAAPELPLRRERRSSRPIWRPARTCGSTELPSAPCRHVRLTVEPDDCLSSWCRGTSSGSPLGFGAWMHGSSTNHRVSTDGERSVIRSPPRRGAGGRRRQCAEPDGHLGDEGMPNHPCPIVPGCDVAGVVDRGGGGGVATWRWRRGGDQPGRVAGGGDRSLSVSTCPMGRRLRDLRRNTGGAATPRTPCAAPAMCSSDRRTAAGRSVRPTLRASRRRTACCAGPGSGGRHGPRRRHRLRRVERSWRWPEPWASVGGDEPRARRNGPRP